MLVTVTLHLSLVVMRVRNRSELRDCWDGRRATEIYSKKCRPLLLPKRLGWGRLGVAVRKNKPSACATNWGQLRMNHIS